MKLLLDENISRKLVDRLGTFFPGTSHAALLGLQHATDAKIWDYAIENNFAIVTRDSDFNERAALYGHPPKIIWLRVGNSSTAAIRDLLVTAAQEIQAFEKDTAQSTLVLWELEQSD